MKKIIAIVVAVLAVNVFANEFHYAIAMVESSMNPKAVGDRGEAVGMYQLHKCYVDDVNRIAKTRYTYEDRWDAVKSKEMVDIYLKHYGARYTRITGKQATYEVLARIHNGGPNGWKKESTVKYWKKVKKHLEK